MDENDLIGGWGKGIQMICRFSSASVKVVANYITKCCQEFYDVIMFKK